jgi:ribosomal protein S12 methylthiotransferase accessory factor
MNHPFTLKDAYKGFTLDQDKVQPPEATVKQVKERFKQLDLKILDDIDNGRLDIPVYFSICGPDAQQLTGTAKQMGKGATPEQAEASAIMELVERFSFYSFAYACDQREIDRRPSFPLNCMVMNSL